MKKDSPFVEIYTDGACSGNPGVGGWCAILRYGEKEKIISGGEKLTTNNRMELIAIIEALSHLKKRCNVKVYTDSHYLLKGVTQWLPVWLKNGWITSSKKPVENRDLWEKLYELTNKHTTKWEWVRGHSGHRENEICDKIAKKEIERIKKSE
ncbi:MAG: ribonuclease HI [Proteobacteria bacterium]|nr:ribonuclease HI [Pseudomonadota bacterium]